MSEWSYDESSYFRGKLKKYQKKRSPETAAMLSNLDYFFTALETGQSPKLIKAGFIHREPKGVVAIDQRGAKGSNHESRLYAYPDESDCTLYLITVGDKNSQDQDIKDCKNFVDRKRKE